MNEQELISKFYNFLETDKKFPSKSLLKQPPVITADGRRFHIDLLLLDTKIGEYIGVVEFSNVIDPAKKIHTKAKVQIYLQKLKAEDVPFYLVFPISDEDFQILIFEDPEWRPISKEEFPEFETLSAKKRIQEKESTEEIKDLIKSKSETIKKEKDSLSIWKLLSAIIGLVTAVSVFYLSPNVNDSNVKTELAQYQNKLDSIVAKLKEWDSLKITTIRDSSLTLDSAKTYKSLNTRIELLEDVFVEKPRRIIEVNNLYKDFEKIEQKIEYQNKLIALQNENLITRIEWLNALVVGIILALLAAALGPIVTNIFLNKSKR